MKEEEIEKLGTLSDGFTFDENTQYSQHTYTLFSDGHWEERVALTNKTTTYYKQGYTGRLPQKGDLKHLEQVWSVNHWVDKVRQYY